MPGRGRKNQEGVRPGFAGSSGVTPPPVSQLPPPASAAIVTQRDLQESMRPVSDKLDRLSDTMTAFCTQAESDHKKLASDVGKINEALNSPDAEKPGLMFRVDRIEQKAKWAAWGLRSLWGIGVSVVSLVFAYWDKIAAFIHQTGAKQ